MSLNKKREEELEAFARLLEIMDELREKCPWDQKQTLESLRTLTIEETYELGDAILAQDLEEVRKELGDLLLHIVFYAKIGSEKKAFDIADVARGIGDKLIQRHPHIYGKVSVQDEQEVKRNWERIKLEEGRRSVLQGVPRSLPAMVKAQRIQEKVAGVGFDWENAASVLEKVEEELAELKEALEAKEPHAIAAEFGDFLFSLINYARFIKVNPENALERTNAKFIKRFSYIEDQARKKGVPIQDLSVEEMNAYWEEAKSQG